ncbi:Putative ankyrin repeat-containing domain superfamily [Colletotrichum destructivum]|uniref:Ankyrin repeat-containing domain superfamily n=1 Tax=Colletotrichum destructivum TaxID=34406 RepID=A0AAX4I1W8_9PEZI|nr:Putative ankyrin repeat-containing domain superfamily [Colletotrichum destructivum]
MCPAMDSPGRLPGAGLADLIRTSQLLADRYTLVANSLNTAPVTLASLATECRAVTDALRRFKYLRETIPETLVFDPVLLDQSCHDALHSISNSLSSLDTYSTRIRPATSDSAVDMSSGQLTIVWNEDSLKQILHEIKTSRQSLAFLLNCVPSEHVTSKNHSTFMHSSRLVSWDCAISPAVLNKGSRLRLSTIGPRPRPEVCPVSDISEVHLALKRLKPPPGTLYKQSMRTTKDLHDAIDREDEAAVVKLLLQRIDPSTPRIGSKLSPLRRALNRQIPSLVTFLAVAGADLEDRGDEGDTILISAIKLGYADKIIALLCELGADVNAVDNLGCSAVHHAAMSASDDDTLAVLVHAGGDIDRRDLGTRTPLVAAVQNYRFNAIEKLLEFGADLELRLQNGRTALHVAISMRSTPMTEFLSDQGAYLDRRVNEHTALTYAIATACPDIAEVLIDAGADVDLPSSKGNFPLLAAAAAGDLLTMKLLLSRGAKYDAAGSEGYLPIHMAAHKNRVEVLQLLFKAGSPIDPTTEHGETPLTIAMHLGCFEAAQFLIEVGADVNHSAPGAERIICQALKAGNTRIAMALIRGGADLTTPLLRNTSMTPLHLAAHYGQNDVLATMVSAGVDLDTRTWPGFTPLFSAVKAGHLATVRLLVTAGAYLRARSTSGANLLFFGTAEPAMMKLLIELGLDIHERDHHGATPLHYAAVKGHGATVKLLLQRGAKVVHASAVFETLQDYKKKSPYRQGTPGGLARQKDHVKIARLIEGWKFKT